MLSFLFYAIILLVLFVILMRCFFFGAVWKANITDTCAIDISLSSKFDIEKSFDLQPTFFKFVVEFRYKLSFKTKILKSPHFDILVSSLSFDHLFKFQQVSVKEESDRWQVF